MPRSDERMARRHEGGSFPETRPSAAGGRAGMDGQVLDQQLRGLLLLTVQLESA